MRFPELKKTLAILLEEIYRAQGAAKEQKAPKSRFAVEINWLSRKIHVCIPQGKQF